MKKLILTAAGMLLALGLHAQETNNCNAEIASEQRDFAALADYANMSSEAAQDAKDRFIKTRQEREFCCVERIARTGAMPSACTEAELRSPCIKEKDAVADADQAIQRHAMLLWNKHHEAVAQAEAGRQSCLRESSEEMLKCRSLLPDDAAGYRQCREDVTEHRALCISTAERDVKPTKQRAEDTFDVDKNPLRQIWQVQEHRYWKCMGETARRHN